MCITSIATGFATLAAAGIAFAAALTPVSPAPPGATEGVTYNPQTGNYVVTYETQSEYTPKGLYQTIYTPATKVDPSVESRFKSVNLENKITYDYRVRNGRLSEQNLRSIVLVASSADPEVASPSEWDGSVVENIGGSGHRVGWSYDGDHDLGGLKPGRSLRGLQLKSRDLPGVGAMELRGATPIQAYAGYGPNQQVTDEVHKLDKKNFVPQFAAVPKITVPDPYDGAAVIDALRAHITKDIVELEMIEPVLASEINRILQAAADAIRRNSIKAAREHLHDAFKLVQKAHPDLDKDDWDDEGDDQSKGKSKKVHPIDRLAARVIAFDIKYVEKRLDKSGDTSGSPGAPSPPAN